MISDKDIPLLYNKLKPYIAKDNWRSGAASQAASGAGGVTAHALYGAAHTGTLDRSQAPWVSGDIATAIALHNTTGDPHSQYVHVSVARTISASHTFAHATAAFTSPDQDSYAMIGRARAGYVGHGDYAGFAHRDYANNEDYALVQSGANGVVALNAPLLSELHIRNGDVDVLRVSESLVEVANVSAATLRTENYASQTTGWSATYNGALDVRYLYADEMHVKAFIADLEQALAGGQIICKSVAKLAADFLVPAYSATTLLKAESFPGWPNAYVFSTGDTIGIKIISRTNGTAGTAGSLIVGWLFGTVSSPSINTTDKTQTWTLTRLSSSLINGFAAGGTASAGTSVEAGAIVLDFGVAGNGYYEVNAIDGQMAANSPYMRIFTWATHPIYDRVVRTSVGNLNGLGFSEYGLYARGADANQYVVAGGTSGILLRNTILRMYDGSNNLFMQADTSGLNYYIQSSPTFADTTSVMFRQAGGTKIMQLTATNNTGAHEGALWVHDGSSDTLLNIISEAPSGQFASTVIQSTVGGNSSQWLFKRLADGTVGADFTGYLGLNPGGTGVNGLEVNMPSSTSAYAMVAKYNSTERFRISIGASADFLQMSSYDAGSGAGPQISVGRNSNGSTAAPGTFTVISAGNSSVGLWPDNSGVWRTAQDTGITSANFASAGSVVGSQTSWHALKQDITPHDATEDLLQAVLAVPLHDFRIIADTVGDAYTGIVITEQDKQDHAWYACNLGGVPALNERNLFGYLIGAIQAQQKIINELKEGQWQH